MPGDIMFCFRIFLPHHDNSNTDWSFRNFEFLFAIWAIGWMLSLNMHNLSVKYKFTSIIVKLSDFSVVSELQYQKYEEIFKEAIMFSSSVW